MSPSPSKSTTTSTSTSASTSTVIRRRRGADQGFAQNDELLSCPNSAWNLSAGRRSFITSRYAGSRASCRQVSPEGQLTPEPLQGCEQYPPEVPGVARQAKLSHSLDPRYRYSRPGCGRSSAPVASCR